MVETRYCLAEKAFLLKKTFFPPRIKTCQLGYASSVHKAGQMFLSRRGKRVERKVQLCQGGGKGEEGKKRLENADEAISPSTTSSTFQEVTFFGYPRKDLFSRPKNASPPHPRINQAPVRKRIVRPTLVRILYSTLYQEKRQTAAAVFETQQKPLPQQSFSSSLFPGPLISIAAFRRGRSSNRGRGGGTGDGETKRLQRTVARSALPPFDERAAAVFFKGNPSGSKVFQVDKRSRLYCVLFCTVKII